MAAETIAKETEQEAQVQAGDGERERSTILFPYGDMDSAVRVAKGVHQVGGSSCQWEQLAAQIGVTATSGGFRMMTLSAKIFSLVTYGQGTVTLTGLGQRICDSKQEKAAKAEAFLSVPLYRAIYDKFKGATLPPASALENEMANMGVAKKQTDKARHTFQRSAQQAGFFAFGQDRLIMPATGPGNQNDQNEPEKEKEDQKKQKKQDDDGGIGGGRHPFIAGLIKELPTEGDDWGTEDRGKWLQAAATIFDLIYKNSGGGKVLKIEVQSAK